MERSVDCLHVLTNYGESGYSSNGKASFSHKRCHLRATLAADFLLLSSFINQVINQPMDIADRYPRFPNEKCEQRIPVLSSKGTLAPSFPPEQQENGLRCFYDISSVNAPAPSRKLPSYLRIGQHLGLLLLTLLYSTARDSLYCDRTVGISTRTRSHLQISPRLYTDSLT